MPGARGAPQPPAQHPAQWRQRDRRGDGDQHAAAQSRGGGGCGDPPHPQPRVHREGPHEDHQGPGLPHGGAAAGRQGHEVGVHGWPGVVHPPRARGDRAPPGQEGPLRHRRHGAALPGKQGDSGRADCKHGGQQEDRRHQRRAGRERPRRHAHGGRGQEQRGPCPRAQRSLQEYQDADQVELQPHGAGGQPAPEALPAAAAAAVPRLPLRRHRAQGEIQPEQGRVPQPLGGGATAGHRADGRRRDCHPRLQGRGRRHEGAAAGLRTLGDPG
mmetsp:Transcript_71406/g.225502  ORF Transcript_71406/g.225502 Transcript_71406/m.225502 type:complete len:271 (+) Transcript_71406:862-1674(+)